MWGREGGWEIVSKKKKRKMCLQGKYVLSSKIIKYTHPKMIDSKSVIYDAIITATNVSHLVVVRIYQTHAYSSLKKVELKIKARST